MERNVGFRTKFGNGNVIYTLREVISLPNFNMNWTWNTGTCPHCKQIIDKTVNHEFYIIEILGPETISNENLKKEDLMVAGFTTDKRYMKIPPQYYNTIFSKSEKFKATKGRNE